MTVPAHPVVRPPRRSETLGSVARALAVVVVGAVLIGGLTSPAQGLLPDWLRSLANSAGGWSMFCFLLVWLSRARPALGAVLGVVAFELMLESYGVVSLWRGVFYAAPLHNAFTLPGVVIGLLLGACAAYVRYGRPARRWVAILPLSVVLLGEGWYGLTAIADSTSPVYWIVELFLAAAFVGAAIGRARQLERDATTRRA